MFAARKNLDKQTVFILLVSDFNPQNILTRPIPSHGKHLEVRAETRVQTLGFEKRGKYENEALKEGDGMRQPTLKPVIGN